MGVLEALARIILMLAIVVVPLTGFAQEDAAAEGAAAQPQPVDEQAPAEPVAEAQSVEPAAEALPQETAPAEPAAEALPQETAPAEEAAVQPPAEPVATEKKETPVETDLHFRLTYKGAFLSDDAGQDHKLMQQLDWTLREKAWGHFKFSLSGDVREDLDGLSNDPKDRTAGILDAYNERMYGFLYRATAEIYKLGPLEYLRLGRQFVRYELLAHMDGINVDFSMLNRRLHLFAYGGIPVRYLDDSDYIDAQTAGAGASMVFSSQTKITLEYQFVNEDGSTGINGTPTEDAQHQAALALRQGFFGYGYGYVAFAMLNEDPRYVKAKFALDFESIGMNLHLSYFGQFIELENMPVSISPFSNLLGPIHPYHHGKLMLSQMLYKEYLSMAIGGEVRMLADSDDEGPFNHSFHHEYLSLTLEDLPVKHLEYTIHADLWQVIGDDEKMIFTGGGEIAYNKRKFLKASVGAYYSMYKYDYYLNLDEQTDVYTLYADGKYYFLDWLYMRARYEMNVYDIYDHRVTVTFGQEL